MRRLCSLGCKSFNIALNLNIISVIIIMYSTNVNVSIRIKRHEIYVVVSCECSFLILIIPSFLVIMQKRENDKKYVIVVLMDFVVIIIKENGISLNWNTWKIITLQSNVIQNFLSTIIVLMWICGVFSNQNIIIHLSIQYN